MDTKMLKSCSDLLAPIPNIIFNNSLELGIVPEALKKVRVTPVYRKLEKVF